MYVPFCHHNEPIISGPPSQYITNFRKHYRVWKWNNHTAIWHTSRSSTRADIFVHIYSYTPNSELRTRTLSKRNLDVQCTLRDPVTSRSACIIRATNADAWLLVASFSRRVLCQWHNKPPILWSSVFITGSSHLPALIILYSWLTWAGWPGLDWLGWLLAPSWLAECSSTTAASRHRPCLTPQQDRDKCTGNYRGHPRSRARARRTKSVLRRYYHSIVCTPVAPYR